MPGPIDLAFVVLFFGASTLWEYLVFWPRLRAAIASGKPGARVQGYRVMIAAEWLGAAFVVALWGAAHRPWAGLWLAVPTGWRLVVSGVLVVAVAGLFVSQARTVAALSPAQRARVRERHESLSVVIPHTAEEHRWFMALAVTAGVCEELLFRGYLMWVVRPWLGLWGAVALVVVAFGLAHAYQGRSDGVRATIAGAVMGAVALLTRSILPGMVVHALVDLGSGSAAYLLMREPGTAPGLRHAT